MGIEKLIPRAKDLGVFLRILARSATGQPITTYSTHFHGPIAGGQLHVVLVDNGRSEILGQEKYRRSLTCIRCGACMNTCPVYRRSGGHSYESTVPGPIGSILAPATDTRKHASLPFACSLCGSCTDVCPVKIDIHNQLLTWRKKIAHQKILPWSKRTAMRLAARLLSHPRLYVMAGSCSRWLLRWLPRACTYNPLNTWGRQRELPPPPKQSFRQIYRRRK
jgi:L-lactate dehydrogenase complex protein LldF